MDVFLKKRKQVRGGSPLWCADSWREINLKTGFEGVCCVKGGIEGCRAGRVF